MELMGDLLCLFKNRGIIISLNATCKTTQIKP